MAASAQVGKSRAGDSNPVAGLFFEYGATVTASINRDKPDEGWACTIDFAGDNYETKKFEVIGIVVNWSFDSGFNPKDTRNFSNSSGVISFCLWMRISSVTF